MTSSEGWAADRPLTERELQVALFLTAALRDGGDSLRAQLKAARVLSEGSCCGSVHILGDRTNGRPVPVHHAFAVEAPWTTRPHRLVRLVIASDGWISHLELVHEEEAEAPHEFPSPLELGQPEVHPF